MKSILFLTKGHWNCGWRNAKEEVGNVSKNEISNFDSGATIGSGSIDVEDEDYYQGDKGVPIGENMEHDGLFELDAKESEDSNDEMMLQV